MGSRSYLEDGVGSLKRREVQYLQPLEHLATEPLSGKWRSWQQRNSFDQLSDPRSDSPQSSFEEFHETMWGQAPMAVGVVGLVAMEPR